MLGALASAFVVAVLFGLVWLHVVLAQNQFRLDRLDNQVAAEESHYERSRLSVDQLEAPQRIVHEAEGKLGMVVPGTVVYLPPSPPPSATMTASVPASPTPSATQPANQPANRPANQSPSQSPQATSHPATQSPTPATGPSTSVPATPGGSNSSVPPAHPPTEWSSVKPLLVPHP